MSESFDTSDIAWLVYRVFYNFQAEVIDYTKRKYVSLVYGSTNINMSGETDFNFGRGWSHSISTKYSSFIKEMDDADDKSLAEEQLEKCKELYGTILNISLMPQTGNLQLTKKGLGNDRLDTFVWALSCYYDCSNSLLFNNSTYENMPIL